jgi:hypothetical protein
MNSLPSRSELNARWNKEYLQVKPEPKRIRRLPYGPCKKCGHHKRLVVDGTCRPCYDRGRNQARFIELRELREGVGKDVVEGKA